MSNYLGAIDQGTTSSRFIVFDRSGRIFGALWMVVVPGHLVMIRLPY